LVVWWWGSGGGSNIILHVTIVPVGRRRAGRGREVRRTKGGWKTKKKEGRELMIRRGVSLPPSLTCRRWLLSHLKLTERSQLLTHGTPSFSIVRTPLYAFFLS